MTPEQRAASDAQRRSAVLVGLAQSIADKGYASTTVADIAAAGRVSKSAVYAHFADKEEVFLALYTAAAQHTVEVVRRTDATSVDDGLVWPDRIHEALHSYLSAMHAGGALTRCLLVEAPAVSDAALRMRRSVIESFVDLLTSIAEDIVAGVPGLVVPDRATVTALVGGLHELMLDAIEQDIDWDLDAQTTTGTRLLIAGLGVPFSVT